MDEKLARKLVRQLRVIKSVLVFFGLLLVVLLAILGFLAYKIVAFTNDVNKRLDSFQSQATQSLDVKQQLCKDNSISSYLPNSSSLCQ